MKKLANDLLLIVEWLIIFVKWLTDVNKVLTLKINISFEKINLTYKVYLKIIIYNYRYCLSHLRRVYNVQ